MNWEVFITCAVTGAGDTVDRHPAMPVAPKDIAAAAVEAAKARLAGHCSRSCGRVASPCRGLIG